MSERNPSLFLQAGSHPAEHFRQLLQTIANGQEGVLGEGDLAVTQNGTPNMSVNVAAGKAFILGDESALQGSYFVHNDAVKNVPLAAADGTNARIDRIVARVRDAEYSGAVNAWAIEAIAGTPSSSPVAPALPSNAITLATVSVPALDTTIETAQITDQRFRCNIGGPVICTSSTRPLNPVEGMQIYETDTDTFYVHSGAIWLPREIVYTAAQTSGLAETTGYKDVAGCSLTLPPGRWLLWARQQWAVSTAAARFYSVRIRNITDTADVGTPATVGAGPTYDIRPTAFVVATLSNTVSKTVRLQTKVDATDGVQNTTDGYLVAQAMTALR